MNNKYKILFIEDEENIRIFIGTLLEAHNYQVIFAKDYRSAQLMFASYMPDLIILDLGLPDRDGTFFIEETRKSFATPIIVLSARSNEKDKVSALDMGANDYITKPFGSAELLARIRSALRNVRMQTEQMCRDGGKFVLDDLVLDYGARQVFICGEEIKLTQTEYNIVALLSEHCGKVLTYSTIIKEIWGLPDDGSIKKLQVNMANIRKKFGCTPGENKYFANELGVGYRMIGKN